MNNRLYRYTGRVLQQTEIVTTRTEWAEDPVESVVPFPTPPIISVVSPPPNSPIYSGWSGMSFSPCLTPEGLQGRMIVQSSPDGGYSRSSDCFPN